MIGGSFGSEKQPDLIPPQVMANVGITARYGLGADCELGANLSYHRLGLDSRCALLSARDDGLTVAPLASVAYLPTRGMEYHGGIDLGAELGPLQPTAHIGISRGARWFFTPRREPRPFGSAYDVDTRSEVRIESSFGLGIEIESDETGLLILAVNPYWRVDEPGGDLRPDGISFSLTGGGLIRDQ